MELTNEQVIEWLKFAQKRIDDITYSPETSYAIEKAIDIIQYASDTNVGDLISRQAAIDAFEMNCYPIRYDHNSIEKGMTITGIKQVLDELPPAQPVQCEDAVSRQAAIEAVKAKRLWHGQYLTNSTAGYDYAIEVLKELPSVQSEPLTGHWIKVTNTLCKCDRCGAVQLKGHFCKDCGAKMEV